VPAEHLALPEVAVIGGGPGGYAAAIGLAQRGARVHLVSDEPPGGTCLHRGCIPTKTLLEVARLAREVRGPGASGLWPAGGAAVPVDWTQVLRRQEQTVAAVAAGLEHLLRQGGVAVVRGRAALGPPARAGEVPPVRVTTDGGQPRELRADAVVLAPGSLPARPALPGSDLPGVLDSDGLLRTDRPPRRLVVIGGGAVGCEFATAHHALGAEVAIVEALPQLLPAADPEVARRLESAFRRRGLEVFTGARVLGIEAGAPPWPLRVRLETPSGPAALPADTVLLATGRRPRTAGMGLEEAGVRCRADGAIVVDEAFRCPGVPGVWAVGDAVGGSMYAHAAFRAAAAAVAGILGLPLPPPAPIPVPVFSYPEVAWVGATQRQAEAAGSGVRVARLPFGVLGRAHAGGDAEGMCKVVADREGRVLGVHLVGPHATELIGAGCLAVARGLHLEELAGTVFPHPTLVEGLGEAAMLLLGRPLHAPRPRSGGEH
jgi:dihydrolipoamide dehydrogenase